MILRGVLVWSVLLVLAILNGVVREALIRPRSTELAAHGISTITLCAAIFLMAFATIGWIGPRATGEALMVGVGWLLLTLGFEFVAGHFLFGKSWETLLADYNVFRGRVWVFVLLSTWLAPLVAFLASRLHSR